MHDDQRIVCVGDALIDLLTSVPELPERGGAVWSTPPVRSPGGTAANVAAGLVKLGTPAAFVGCVGDDEYGRFLGADLDARQVDVTGLRYVREALTGVAIAMVEPGGERTFIAGAQGAGQTRLSLSDLEGIPEYPAAIFLTGLTLLEEPSRSTTLELASRYTSRTPIYFDPNLRQPGSESNPAVVEAMHAAAAMSSVVLAGEGEVMSLGLRPVGSQVLVVKRGAEGARLLTRLGVEVNVAAFPVDAVDSTGAGDAFNAGYIAARTRGHEPARALRLANASAALSVTRRGARSAPAWDEVLRMCGEDTDE